MGLFVSRRQLLGATGCAAVAIGTRSARAARPHVLRLGLNLPSEHSITTHTIAAAAHIKSATDGAVQIEVFPNSQLGNDAHTLSEVRSGAIQMATIGDTPLSNLVPSSAIDNIGFAFKDSQTAWNALDGAVGDFVRPELIKAGLQPMHRIWDEGFRQVTSGTHQINTPKDLHGFKIRVPPEPIMLSLFERLGAAPFGMDLSELYTGLQTHVADGQENPLSVIETDKFYQVQKYCSLTSHIWVGYWVVMNGAYWNSLPANYRKIISDAFDKAALAQRSANQAQDSSLRSNLSQQGLVFAEPDRALFRETLAKSGYYKKWQKEFGPTLWSALEKYTGALA